MYGEAPFLHKRGGLYYFSFSTGWPGQIVIHWNNDDPRRVVATAVEGSSFVYFKPGATRGTYLGNQIVFDTQTGKAQVSRDSGKIGTIVFDGVTIDVRAKRMKVDR